VIRHPREGQPRIPTAEENRRDAQRAIAVGSRTFAVVICMMVPPLLGWYLDSQLGTSYWVIAGVLVGMVLGTAGLLALVRVLSVSTPLDKSENPSVSKGDSEMGSSDRSR
jgi:F0F1-type ATP synthase assembly protein I